MTAEPPSMRKYGDAGGYDLYMGQWSAALAPLFLAFADVRRPASILDIGCGTGNLLAAAAASFIDARLVGIDPSRQLLERARQRPDLTAVEFVEGTAEALPFADASFDACLSLLVLQEFPDQGAALAAMRRVTRPGGIVAACQWNFTNMPIIDALVDAIIATSEEAGRRITSNSAQVIADEAELRQHWMAAGFEDISTGRIEVSRRFESFDDLWLPLLAGSTPSTLTLASLPAEERAQVCEHMKRRLDVIATDAALSVTAEAIAVRGRA